MHVSRIRRAAVQAAIFCSVISLAASAQQDPQPSPTNQSPVAERAAEPRVPGGSAVGDLLVAPTRLIFEGRTRSAEVTLVNIGNETATYRISFINLRMTDDGGLKEYADAKPEDMPAAPLIRYSPRQVTLEPHIAQTVRLQVRKPADLATGEYRSHLLFRAVPKTEDVAPEASDEKPKGLQIRLIPVYGVSIPVIVREGDLSVNSSITDLSVEQGATAGEPQHLKVKINRSGNESVYGNLRVVLEKNGRNTTVGVLNGVAVYTPNPFRWITIPLRAPENVTLDGGRLRVEYSEQAEAGGGTIAKAELQVP
ncbi:MAG: fimbria/pilus periplasmic chaperone [Thermoanaerobaculia bacterium]